MGGFFVKLWTYICMFGMTLLKADSNSCPANLPAASKYVDHCQCSRKYPSVRNLHWSQKKRILVTGGAGFVGSHLVDRLMEDGHEVIALDNFATGKRHNIEHWLGHSNFEFIRHDVSDPIHIEADEIYHLASPASPPHYMHNPVRTIKANTLGTLNMLGLARRMNAKFLFASTSEIYGDPDVHPQPETYWGNVNPVGPRACYDESKRLGETLTAAYSERLGLSVRIARIFNTHGPRMQLNDGRVVSNFIIQALTNQPITIFNSREQRVGRTDLYDSGFTVKLCPCPSAIVSANYLLAMWSNVEQCTVLHSSLSLDKVACEPFTLHPGIWVHILSTSASGCRPSFV